MSLQFIIKSINANVCMREVLRTLSQTTSTTGQQPIKYNN